MYLDPQHWFVSLDIRSYEITEFKQLGRTVRIWMRNGLTSALWVFIFQNYCKDPWSGDTDALRLICSVVDPNTRTLNLDPDPGFWPNLDPDPGPDPDPG